MPRTCSSIEKIRAELAWVTETPDPKKVRLPPCSLRGNWANFCAKLSMIQDVNNGQEYHDANVKIGADISKESPPSLDIAGILDDTL
jgi:hypothetical protein